MSKERRELIDGILEELRIQFGLLEMLKMRREKLEKEKFLITEEVEKSALIKLTIDHIQSTESYVQALIGFLPKIKFVS